LAEDLERFLQRRPLAHTRNPSRKERARNWAIRHRRLVAVNAFYLTVLALISPMLIARAQMLLKQPPPPLLERPEFHLAVKELDADEPDYASAIGRFEVLAEEYPRSSLPLSYLGLAHAWLNALPEDAAQRYYQAAMRQPDAEAELTGWARAHPRFAEQLSELGTNRLERARTPLQEQPGHDKAKELRKIFEVADHAWTHALKVFDSDIEALHGLATIAEFRGEFEAARERLTDLIRQVEEDRLKSHREEWPSWLIQRARVTTRLGVQVAATNEPADLARALALVNEAVRDLEACSQGVDEFLMHVFVSVRTEALLTRGEFHCLLGSVQLAEADCRDARVAMEAWFSLTRAAGEVVPDDVESKYRNRLHNLQKCVGVDQAAPRAATD
jgi:tetratricopeptide (TPR) repeat protein